MQQATEQRYHPEYRSLPPGGFPRFIRLFSRALLLHCPLCGSGGIFRRPWDLHERCPQCGYRFEREPGYWVGAYAVNLVVSEFVGLGAVVIWLLRSDYPVMTQQVIAVIAAIIFPLVFFPWSRTLWMAIDLMLEPEQGSESAADRARRERWG